MEQTSSRAPAGQVAGASAESLAHPFELIGVSKRYGRVTALDNVHLQIRSGKTTVLIGPSGCGKSTTLRVMIQLVRPDQGVIQFEGEPLTDENSLAARRRMGYVIQDGGLFPHLTARENATIMARYLKWPREKLEARLTELCGLTHFPQTALTRYPAQLSGGQQQRVSLMRALMLDPDVLLLDEPLGALDPMIRAELQSELRDIFRTLGKTVVMVTHDLHEAVYFAHSIVLMRGGRIIQQGSPDELTDRPADEFVTRFVSAQRPMGTQGNAKG